MKTVQESGTDLLERIIRTIGDLPTPPDIVAQVLDLTSDLDTNPQDLAGALMKDQSLTAKVLRLANSPFYGRSREVSSMKDAVAVLGFQSVRSIVVASNVRRMFRGGKNGNATGTLWVHSLASATGARVTALRVKGVSTELAYLGGLLKEIGTMVLLNKMPKEYGAVMRDTEFTNTVRSDRDRESLGFTHLELAAQILERWNLPESLPTIVRHYDNTESLTDDVCTEHPVEVVSKTANVVHFASDLAESMGFGIVERETAQDVPLSSIERLTLTPDSVSSITQETAERFEEERIFADA